VGIGDQGSGIRDQGSGIRIARDTSGLPALRRQVDDEQADDERGKPYERRSQESTHVRSPLLRITPTTSVVKLIPTIQLVNRTSIGRFSTRQDQRWA